MSTTDKRKNTTVRANARRRGDHPGASPSSSHRRGDEFSADVETTDSFRLFLNQAGRYPLLTKAEEIDLAQRIERGDLAAKERLVNSNIRLVISVARKYQGYGLSLPDLVQEAMLGLIRAAEKFDWRRGYKFSTYATLWIRQSIQRGLDNSGKAIRIPTHVAQQVRNLSRAEAELTVKLDREPTDEELAASHPKLVADELAALRDLSRVTTSLDQSVSSDSETTLGDLRAASTAAPDEDVADSHRSEAVGVALAALPEREREVLELRFGTGDQPEADLREIGRRLGITKERARQLEAQALERLAAAGSLDAWRDAA